MAVQTATPTEPPQPLDIQSRLEAVLDEELNPTDQPEVTRDSSEAEEKKPPETEEETPPKIKEPGEESEPIAADEEESATPEVKEPETPGDTGDEIRTMADLAKVFEVDEAEFLDHITVPNVDGTEVPLSRVIATFKTAPAAIQKFEDLEAREAAFVQESQVLRARTDEQVRDLAIHAQTLLDITTSEFKDIDWNKLENDDPQQYLIMKNKQTERGRLIQGAVEKLRGIDQQRVQEMQAANSTVRQQEMVHLHGKMPEWRDPAVAKPAMEQTQSFLMNEMGFSVEEVNGITDHRQLLVAWEASEYRKLKQTTPKKIEKLRGLPSPKRVLRTGARRDASADNRKESQKKFDRLKQTGDEADAARLFEEMF